MPVHANHLKLPAMEALLTAVERKRVEKELGSCTRKPARPDDEAPRLFG